MSDVTIRLARPEDHETLVQFNQAMALETESRTLEPAVISEGVRAVFNNPAYGFYAVAEFDNQLVGGLMVTQEWSDWRNGVFWWIQSVYVTPQYRKRGIYRRLYGFVQERARQEPGVCGFRLYVEKDNQAAQATYQKLGMQQTPYRVFESLGNS